MKKLFLILIAFFSVSVFSQDPFDRKQREQTEYPKEGLTLPPVSACVYSEPRLAEERPLAQLHIVGVVQYGKQAEVLFNDNGHILSVQVGQRIGKEGYLIEKVSKNSVRSVFNVFFDPMDNLLSGRESRLFTSLKTGPHGGDTPATCS